MKVILTFFAALTSFAAFGYGQTPPAKYDDSDAYSIYAALISQEWPAAVAKASKLVVQSETGDYPSYGNDDDVCLKPDPSDESTLGPLVKAYREANKNPSLLSRKIDLPFDYDLVPKETFLAFFKEKNIDGWKDFYKKYPNSGGFIEVSAVGFNSGKTLALVYVGHSCGGLCGGGRYHLLKKVDNKWTEIPWKGTTCTWAS